MKTTTEMKLVPIEKLIPYVNNARTHNAEQINKLRSSLREFGFINPVIIDAEYNIIAGHGRVMAAKEEHIKEVPCVFADHLTPAQKKAYIIADNRMAQDAGWDEELLKIEIEALQAEAFDVELTGFEAQEIADISNNVEYTQRVMTVLQKLGLESWDMPQIVEDATPSNDGEEAAELPDPLPEEKEIQQ